MAKKRVIGITFTYIGAVVGAGFSSGQEIWRFFARHQLNGIYGIVITGIIFILFTPLIFRLGKILEIDSYHQFFYKYLPVPLPFLFDLIYSIFLVGSIAVMLAGTGALFNNLLGLPYFIGVIFTLIFILITLFLKKEGVLVVSSVLIPALIIITITVISSFLNRIDINYLCFIEKNIIERNTANWYLDSLLYGAYNMVMAIAVMSSIVSREKTKDIIIGGILGGIILSILNILIYIGLASAFHSTPQQEIPLLYLAVRCGKQMYLAYIIALYFAMLTTAIANFYAFTNRFTDLFNIKYETGVLISIFIVLALVPAGFSTLVNYLYPFFGYISIIIIIFYLYLLFSKIQKKI